MNPRGVVVSENTNGIITVNGHSYEDPNRYTETQTLLYLSATTLQSLLRTVMVMVKVLPV